MSTCWSCAGARVPQDLDRRGHQDQAEDQEHPVERRQRRGSDGDEDPAQDQRADDPVQQDPLLELARHGERGQQQHEDEQVVHAQRLLDEVAGEVLQAAFGAEVGPDVDPEEQGQRDVERRPAQGLLHGDRVRATGQGEVDHDQQYDGPEDRGPQHGRPDRVERAGVGCGSGERGGDGHDSPQECFLRSPSPLAWGSPPRHPRGRRTDRKGSRKYSPQPPVYGVRPAQVPAQPCRVAYVARRTEVFECAGSPSSCSRLTSRLV